MKKLFNYLFCKKKKEVILPKKDPFKPTPEQDNAIREYYFDKYRFRVL